MLHEMSFCEATTLIPVWSLIGDMLRKVPSASAGIEDTRTPNGERHQTVHIPAPLDRDRGAEARTPSVVRNPLQSSGNADRGTSNDDPVCRHSELLITCAYRKNSELK